TGKSTMKRYQIVRGTASNAETLLTTVSGTQTKYDDLSATDTSKTYYYKVVAVNGVRMSCRNNEIVAPYVGDTCTGLILQRTPPGHPEQSSQRLAPASLDINYIGTGNRLGSNSLVFSR